MNLFAQFRNWWNEGQSFSETQYINQLLSGTISSAPSSGVVLAPKQNLTVSSVWQAIEIIANPISTMEFKVYQRKKNGKSEAPDNIVYDLLNYKANPDQTALKLKQTLMLHVLLYGNGYVRIYRDADGYPIELYNLDPTKMVAELNNNGALKYKHDGKAIPSENIIHVSKMSFDGVIGFSLNEIGSEGISLAKSLELFGATFFGNNCVPSGFIKTAVTNGSPEAIKAYEAEINRDYGGLANANKIKMLKPGMEWVPNAGVGMGEQSQFTASRQFQLTEVCRYLNLNPARIGAAPEPTDTEAYNTMFYQQTIQPWVEQIEAEFNCKLFGDVERKVYYCEMDFSSLLRANSNGRADYYTKLFAMGAISPNEIRLLDNLGEAVAGGDSHFIPVNNLKSLESIESETVEVTPAAPGEVAAPVETEVAPTADIQQTALNGAQISSLLEITTQISLGQIPGETASALIAAAFPALTHQQISDIVSPLNGFKAEAPAAPGTPAEAPATPQAEATPGTDAETLSAVRSVVTDAVARMIRKEAEAVLRHANKPQAERSTALEQFYSRHDAIIREAIAPSVRAFVAVAKPTDSADLLIDAITSDLTQYRGHMEAVESVSELVDSWGNRAQEITALL